ncbi:hypothetical protein DM01DRAFT_1403692 [Hesseltinella vesiculosa]|uniref:Uncharacterized protein n=1 Tax=Hesseltinella vesiculosa TaxID=101127 RepID=A0A1X2GVA2_9FUNG|nr:hypothetical protein DM01DRAFT_1403692 [Hesseltinella vesiculosa]
MRRIWLLLNSIVWLWTIGNAWTVVPGDETRFDADDYEPLPNEQYMAGNGLNGDGELPPALVNSTPWIVNASDTVTVELLCVLDHSFCAKVLDAISHAVDYFTEVVHLRRRIVVRAAYYEFCDHVCANDTYGMGAPANQFTLPFKDGDMNFVYPQALAKQLSPYDYTSSWSNYDIMIELNHDPYTNALAFTKNNSLVHQRNGTSDDQMNPIVPQGGKYWFRTDGDLETILPHQIDFEYIVLHQVLHGAGFTSSWAAYFANEASPFRTLLETVVPVHDLMMLTPSPYWMVEPTNGGPTYVTGFQPTMIFDKYLYLDNGTTSLMEIGFDMQDFCAQGADAFIIHFVQLFRASPSSALARRLYTQLDQAQSALTFRLFDNVTLASPIPLTNITFNASQPNETLASVDINDYIQQVYQELPLLTGHASLNALNHHEQPSRLFRPGVSLAHVDDSQQHSLDFIMTSTYQEGITLQAWTQHVYDRHPSIFYLATVNSTATPHPSPHNASDEIPATPLKKKSRYLSPIGPGILRILETLGYDTVLDTPPVNNDVSSSAFSAPRPEKKRCGDVSHAATLKSPPSKSKLASQANHLWPTCAWFSLNSLFYIVVVLFLLTDRLF